MQGIDSFHCHKVFWDEIKACKALNIIRHSSQYLTPRKLKVILIDGV